MNILSNHPCFNEKVRNKYARIHLPVAPLCNVQCRFCNRKYDCANENRPGVTSTVLSPGQAFLYFQKQFERKPEISVVGIAGPGDPFANPEETLETLHFIRAFCPNMLLCVASNGFNLLPYADELKKLNVSHVTITLNTLDPLKFEKIYRWARLGKKIYRGVEGGILLIERQTAAIKILKEYGITVKINTIILPGINEEEIPEIAYSVKSLGADIMNCLPLLPAPGSDFEGMKPPSPEMIHGVRAKAGEALPQMSHCSRCRADACGIIGEANTEEDDRLIRLSSTVIRKDSEQRNYIAVATREGMFVNQHLGEADYFTVYKSTERGVEIVEKRKAPERGTGVKRWLDLAHILNDCRTILVSGSGETPRKVIEGEGIRIVEMEGLIEEGVTALLENREIPAVLKRRFMGCGAACSGKGDRCA